MQQQILSQFKERFGAEGRLYSSAGRINLIGEHTDYNGGFVFPGAIDRVIMAAIRPNGLERVRLYSVDMQEACEFSLREEDAPQQQWARYVFGVCREMMKRGYEVRPFDALFAGNVPLGAGLSSSAALESCFAYALSDLYNNASIPLMELARIGQSTEHNYCGVMCGIMDQFASLHGREGCLMRLDCRSMEFQYFPFRPEGYRLVLVNSKVKHALVDSPYNRRRQSCERVAATLGMETLRDATFEQLEGVRSQISEEDYMRARYVIGEKHRVLDVCEALERGDYETVGARMYETHWGMSKDYEVSCEELDFLATLAEQMGVTGARIMGGGFGGCTINLVKEERYEPFIEAVLREFPARYGVTPEIIPVVISNGAQRL